MNTNILLTSLFYMTFQTCLWAQAAYKETFQPIENGKVPQTVEELWKDFDPRQEPLDVEILKEWEEEGVMIKILRYRIGIFKGKKAMMAAIYGYPKDGNDLPGLVQIHGGGQYADYRAVLTNGRRGYATISISWAGRINAPDYMVTPEVVKLFWAGDTLNPEYKLTTDWGLLDGYHAPTRYPENSFGSIEPQSWTLDAVESPRNNSWFLAAVGARRALTFLEQQAHVDPDKLGIYGHSMGGKLTLLTSIDPRVKAAAPSCGGISDNNNTSQLFLSTLADNAYLKKITCPIIFLSPSNDFHGHLQDIPKAVRLIKTDDWRVASSPHHSHQDHGNFEVTGLLWFDQHLKGAFTYPKTPVTTLDLNTKSKIPTFSVSTDASKPIIEVEIYYTQQGGFDSASSKQQRRNHRVNRFWHYAKAVENGASWMAELPLYTTEKSLWAYANIRYALDEPVTGAGYYYRIYTVDNFTLSSPVQMVTSEQLQAAGVKATLKPSLAIEDFNGDWQKDWFAYKPQKWEIATHKIYNDLWKASKNAKLEFVVLSAEPNVLVVSSGSYATEIWLPGGSERQKITLSAQRLQNPVGEALTDWSIVKELKFSASGSFRERADGQIQQIYLGAEWKGERPELKSLRWVKN